MNLPKNIVLSLAMSAALMQGCLNREKPVHPSRRDVTQAIYASGKVYPLNYYRANSSVGGYLQKLYVQVGDSVHEGQPLFSIKNELSDYNISVARNNMTLAKSNLAENSSMMKAAREEIAAAYTKFRLDSTNYVRYKNLWAEQATTQVALDQARTLSETSFQNYQRAQETYKSTRQKLRTDVANAEQVYKSQQVGKDNFTINSAINGRVYDIAGRLGELIAPQVVVMEIGQVGAYEVELAIDETDINWIHEGQEVVYSSDAFPNRYFSGKIKKIYPKIGLVNKSIKALATIEMPADVKFYAGSTIEANIIFEKQKNVLVLPKFYVHNDSVRVNRDGKAQRIKIKTGLNDVEFVQIVEGLSEQDEVFKP